MSFSYSVRLYDAARDAAMIASWRAAHGASPVPEVLIPPTALVVERGGVAQAFGCLYLCDVADDRPQVRLSFMEWLTGRPGMGLGEARRVMRHLVLALRACASRNDSDLTLGHCEPAVAREGVRLGFRKAGTGLICVACHNKNWDEDGIEESMVASSQPQVEG
ncbi:MAG: hypothetical protein ACAI34_14190 [Verrucomicrobium sp.]|nr:hypothetical protein [Verrucomicrobium sp.]